MSAPKNEGTETYQKRRRMNNGISYQEMVNAPFRKSDKRVHGIISRDIRGSTVVYKVWVGDKKKTIEEWTSEELDPKMVSRFETLQAKCENGQLFQTLPEKKPRKPYTRKLDKKRSGTEEIGRIGKSPQPPKPQKNDMNEKTQKTENQRPESSVESMILPFDSSEINNQSTNRFSLSEFVDRFSLVEKELQSVKTVREELREVLQKQDTERRVREEEYFQLQRAWMQSLEKTLLEQVTFHQTIEDLRTKLGFEQEANHELTFQHRDTLSKLNLTQVQYDNIHDKVEQQQCQLNQVREENMLLKHEKAVLLECTEKLAAERRSQKARDDDQRKHKMQKLKEEQGELKQKYEALQELYTQEVHSFKSLKLDLEGKLREKTSDYLQFEALYHRVVEENQTLHENKTLQEAALATKEKQIEELQVQETRLTKIIEDYKVEDPLFENFIKELLIRMAGPRPSLISDEGWPYVIAKRYMGIDQNVNVTQGLLAKQNRDLQLEIHTDKLKIGYHLVAKVFNSLREKYKDELSQLALINKTMSLQSKANELVTHTPQPRRREQNPYFYFTPSNGASK